MSVKITYQERERRQINRILGWSWCRGGGSRDIRRGTIHARATLPLHRPSSHRLGPSPLSSRPPATVPGLSPPPPPHQHRLRL
ncbi:hypothetical protein J6590_056983 [Homalodisca vitripennis]|nr:hypothetical protein J6590_056983 [Homalodisca vitripennis]